MRVAPHRCWDTVVICNQVRLCRAEGQVLPEPLSSVFASISLVALLFDVDSGQKVADLYYDVGVSWGPEGGTGRRGDGAWLQGRVGGEVRQGMAGSARRRRWQMSSAALRQLACGFAPSAIPPGAGFAATLRVSAPCACGRHQQPRICPAGHPAPHPCPASPLQSAKAGLVDAQAEIEDLKRQLDKEREHRARVEAKADSALQAIAERECWCLCAQEWEGGGDAWQQAALMAGCAAPRGAYRCGHQVQYTPELQQTNSTVMLTLLLCPAACFAVMARIGEQALPE